MADRITIDDAGRLVIPKPVRESLGLHGGRALEVRTEGERLILDPIPEEATVEERNGILVVSSDLKGPLVDHRDERSERFDRLAGVRE